MVKNRTQANQSFEVLLPGISIGLPTSEDWISIKNQPLVIIVGLTGAGKSTIINKLTKSGLNFTLLPNRRTLTTKLIIPNIVAKNRQNIEKICRLERFKLTRQYQQKIPGGMGYILTELQINPQKLNYPLIFDGLRGEQEVIYAASFLKKAKFVMLEAPLLVRLKRLLTRIDSFDKIKIFSKKEVVDPEKINSFSDLGVPQASSVLTFAEEQEILTEIEKGIYQAIDVSERLKILVEESINYNSEMTKRALQTIAPERTLLLDTTKVSLQQLTQKLLAYLP